MKNHQTTDAGERSNERGLREQRASSRFARLARSMLSLLIVSMGINQDLGDAINLGVMFWGGDRWPALSCD